MIGVAEIDDVCDTAVLVPLTFTASNTPRPDLIFKRRGGTWSYALRIQNDGDVDDDLTVSLTELPFGFTIRFIVGRYDVTAAVNAGGFTFHDVAPGEVLPFAVQFRAEETARVASRAVTDLRLSSDPPRSMSG